MKETTLLFHNIAPVYDADSRVLILGSFPSSASREQGFFYGHKNNRFWRVLASVFAAPLPETVEEKRKLLLSHGLALWDVIASCEIVGSADSSIRAARPNDLTPLLASCQIETIFTNGRTAASLYDRHLLPVTGHPAVCLPSTSPANAAWSFERLCAAWSLLRR